MAIESSYPAITDLGGTELMTAITTPGVAGGTKTISTANIANSTIMVEKIRDVIGSTLVAGANTTIAVDDAANTVTISATTATVYTDENARDAIGAALVGEVGYIDVTPNDAGDQIVVSTNQSLKDSIAALGTKPMIQSNDSITGSSVPQYANFPGTSGAYISTPDSAGLDIDGDLDIRVRVSLTDWTPAANTTLVSKWNTGANSWLFRITTAGAPALLMSIDGTTAGTTATSTLLPTVADGQTIWIRCNRTASDGTTDFYWAADSATEPTSWTALSINRATTPGVLANV